MTRHPKTVEEFLAWLDWRRNNAYDNIVVIDGEEGNGKSNTALTLAAALDGDDFDPRRIIFKTEEWHGSLVGTPKKKTWVLDEGGNLALSWEWSSAEGRALVKIMQQCRVLYGTMLWCIPNSAWLNIYLREHRVIARLAMVSRGVCVPFYRERNPVTNETHWERGATWRIPDLREANPILSGIYNARKEASVPSRIAELAEDIGLRGVEAEVKRQKRLKMAATLKAKAGAE